MFLIIFGLTASSFLKSASKPGKKTDAKKPASKEKKEEKKEEKREPSIHYPKLKMKKNKYKKEEETCIKMGKECFGNDDCCYGLFCKFFVRPQMKLCVPIGDIYQPGEQPGDQ